MKGKRMSKTAIGYHVGTTELTERNVAVSCVIFVCGPTVCTFLCLSMHACKAKTPQHSPGPLTCNAPGFAFPWRVALGCARVLSTC